jgi:hypothetical protein
MSAMALQAEPCSRKPIGYHADADADAADIADSAVSGVGKRFRRRWLPGVLHMNDAGNAASDYERLVVRTSTKDVFYTATHYGDQGSPPFTHYRPGRELAHLQRHSSGRRGSARRRAAERLCGPVLPNDDEGDRVAFLWERADVLVGADLRSFLSAFEIMTTIGRGHTSRSSKCSRSISATAVATLQCRVSGPMTNRVDHTCAAATHAYKPRLSFLIGRFRRQVGRWARRRPPAKSSGHGSGVRAAKWTDGRGVVAVGERLILNERAPIAAPPVRPSARDRGTDR